LLLMHVMFTLTPGSSFGTHTFFSTAFRTQEMLLPEQGSRKSCYMYNTSGPHTIITQFPLTCSLCSELADSHVCRNIFALAVDARDVHVEPRELFGN
jgi:hypothetical protein